MSTEENKAIVRRWIEARNNHDVEAAVALFADDWQDHVRHAFVGFTESFPDVHITAEEMIGEGGEVALRWTFRGTHRGTYLDIPATGKIVDWKGIDLYTIMDGKITALVREADSLSVLQQLEATNRSRTAT